MADKEQDNNGGENHVNPTESTPVKSGAEHSNNEMSVELQNNALVESVANKDASQVATDLAPNDKQAKPSSAQDTNHSSLDSVGVTGTSVPDRPPPHLSPVVDDSLCSLSDSERKQEVNSFSLLKKDDSGIVLQSSPGGEKSNSEGEQSTNEKKPDALFDVGAGAHGGWTSLSSFLKESDRNSDHSTSSQEMEQDVESQVVVMRPERVSVIRSRRIVSDSDDDDDDNDSNDESMDHDRTQDSSNEKSDDGMDIDLETPKDTWRPLFEVHKREQGYGNRIPMSYVFSNRCGASVHLVQRLQLYSKLDHHEGCVNALHFNKQGTLLASGSDDLNVVVWNWLDKKPFFFFDSGHRSNVFQSKFMPYSGDTHIVTCARDGQIRLAELSSTGTCKKTKRLAQHRGVAHKLALLQDSSHVFYSCGEDSVTYEIDLRQEKPNKLSTTKENNRKVPLYSIHSNPFKSHEYCVSGRDHHIRVFDKRMGSEGDNSGLVKKFCPHHLQGAAEHDLKANVTCAVYNYNGQEIMGTYNDEDIYLFDNTHSDGADAVHRYKGHRNNATVKGVNFYGPKSEYIITGSDCGNIFIWEKESEKIVHFFQGDDAGVVNVLEPHPNAPILATSGLDHDIKVWMPMAPQPTKLEGLKRVVRRNMKERAEERLDPDEAIDSSTFWRLMQHFRRTARRRARQDGEDVSTDSDSDADSDSEDEEGEDECVVS